MYDTMQNMGSFSLSLYEQCLTMRWILLSGPPYWSIPNQLARSSCKSGESLETGKDHHCILTSGLFRWPGCPG